MPATAASITASAPAVGTKISEAFAPRLADGLGDRVEDRHGPIQDNLTALARGRPGDHVRAVCPVRSCVELTSRPL